jgi:transcriptional regulator with XRE-family HTH domain
VRSVNGLYHGPRPDGIPEPIEGAELRERRRRLGLWQAELASGLGISRALVAQVESGRRRLPARVLPRLIQLEKAGDSSAERRRAAALIEAERAVLRVVDEIDGPTKSEIRDHARPGSGKGYGRDVLAALSELESRGQLHRERRERVSAHGRLRRPERYFRGPGVARVYSASDAAEFRKGFSLVEFGRELGVSPASLRAHELGKVELPPVIINNAAAARDRLLDAQRSRDDEIAETIRQAGRLPFYGRNRTGLVCLAGGERAADELAERLKARGLAHERSNQRARYLLPGPPPAISPGAGTARELTQRAGWRSGAALTDRRPELALALVDVEPAAELVEPELISGAAFRQAREAAGVSAAHVCRLLGLHPSLLSVWELHESPTPMAYWDALADLYETGLSELSAARSAAAEGRRADLIARIPPEGISRHALTRYGRGTREDRETDADELIAAGLAHRESRVTINRDGITRALELIVPGPEGTAVEPTMTAEELKALMLRKGAIGTRRLADVIRSVCDHAISRVMIAKHRNGTEPIPTARAHDYRRALDTLPDAAGRSYRRTSDAELDAAILAAVAATPGRSAKQVLEAVPGEIKRRWARLRLLQETECIRTESALDAPDSLNRRYQRELLYPVDRQS